MNWRDRIEPALEMARLGRLYPSVILHGGGSDERREAAALVARTLLCERDAEERPCGTGRHCRRIAADPGAEAFHPDFHRLERDQKTVTSIEVTRRFLTAAQMAPFEARGQVFVIAAAETLGPEAADTLLKILEEPPPRTPRHFLLLTPSDRELASTLRSRSMPIFLGAEEGVDETERDERAAELEAILGRFLASGAQLHLLAAATELGRCGGWDDLRSAAPWSLAAATVVECARRDTVPASARSALLDLAAALLDARAERVRGITPQRILEGLVVRHLGGVASPVAGR